MKCFLEEVGGAAKVGCLVAGLVEKEDMVDKHGK